MHIQNYKIKLYVNVSEEGRLSRNLASNGVAIVAPSTTQPRWLELCAVEKYMADETCARELPLEKVQELSSH